MSLRLKVAHRSTYRYEAEVASSYNEARLVPQTGVSQLTLSSTVTTTPAAVQHRYWDYWGTQVTVFDVHVPHDSLEVTCTSTVDTADAAAPPQASWDDLARAAAGSPYEVLQSLAGLAHERVTYQPGSTGVGTSAVEAWSLGQGVCQDIAHVTLALLREAGVPARYVSGYLHPGKEPVVGETVAGESHAWVEAWLGGWWGFDPTNQVPAGERHVVVARGRDYTDVPPLKGVYAGGGAQRLEVTVEVTRLA